MAAAKMALSRCCPCGGKPGGGCIHGTCGSEDAAAGWSGFTAGCVSCDCEASTGVTWAAGTSCESAGGDATKIEVPTCCTTASPVANSGSTPPLSLPGGIGECAGASVCGFGTTVGQSGSGGRRSFQGWFLRRDLAHARVTVTEPALTPLHFWGDYNWNLYKLQHLRVVTLHMRGSWGCLQLHEFCDKRVFVTG